jgi:hypothetical protein
MGMRSEIRLENLKRYLLEVWEKALSECWALLSGMGRIALQKAASWLSMVVHTCNTSYMGGKGRRIAVPR